MIPLYLPILRPRARWLFAALLLLHVATAPASAQVPEQPYDGTEDYPGYCQEDWRGEASCFEGSTRPWPSPPILPAMAQIVRIGGAQDNLANAQGEHVCGATLVAPDWVLTASACVDRRNMDEFMVRYGLPSIAADGEAKTAVLAYILEVVPHPDARPGRRADLALIHFEADPRVHVMNPRDSRVPLTPDTPREESLPDRERNYVYFRPPETQFPWDGAPPLVFADVSIQPPLEWDNSVWDEAIWRSWQNAIHVRWDTGIPSQADRLNQEPFFLIPNALCNDLRDLGPRYDENVICALSHDRVLCPADNGSPVMGTYDYIDSSELLVVAVASFRGDSCDEAGKPGRFTLTAPYAGWIRGVLHESYAQRMAESGTRVCRRLEEPSVFRVGDDVREMHWYCEDSPPEMPVQQLPEVAE